MYPNSSDTPSARGQELVQFKPQDDVLEGVIVDGPFRFHPGGNIPRPNRAAPPSGPTAEEITKAFLGFGSSLSGWFDEIARKMAAFGEAARDAGLIAEEPPTDPRARALWMKQHRNHGPETPKNWRKR